MLLIPAADSLYLYWNHFIFVVLIEVWIWCLVALRLYLFILTTRVAPCSKPIRPSELQPGMLVSEEQMHTCFEEVFNDIYMFGRCLSFRFKSWNTGTLFQAAHRFSVVVFSASFSASVLVFRTAGVPL